MPAACSPTAGCWSVSSYRKGTGLKSKRSSCHGSSASSSRQLSASWHFCSRRGCCVTKCGVVERTLSCTRRTGRGREPSGAQQKHACACTRAARAHAHARGARRRTGTTGTHACTSAHIHARSRLPACPPARRRALRAHMEASEVAAQHLSWHR